MGKIMLTGDRPTGRLHVGHYVGCLLYTSLKKAMKEANREFQDILKDIQQNQILHMAMPDKELENMAQSVNQA